MGKLKFSWYRFDFDDLPLFFREKLDTLHNFGKVDMCIDNNKFSDNILEWLHDIFDLDNIVQVSWGYRKLIIHVFNTDEVNFINIKYEYGDKIRNLK